MHNSYYSHIIKKVAADLDIQTDFLSDNWVICLKKGDQEKFIVSYLFPLNDACSSKIANNKNVLSDILTKNSIPNVPHQLIISSSKLKERNVSVGNFQYFNSLISQYGFPIILKKNNSSKGKGVYKANNSVEFEDYVIHISKQEETFCISPFRKNAKEYRCIILDGKCLLTYEKVIPTIKGNGKDKVIDLVSKFFDTSKENGINFKRIVDTSLIDDFKYIPTLNEKINLHWKHNKFIGTKYIVVENENITALALKAAAAINARFVSVDVFYTEDFGYEVLEINSSVFIHSMLEEYDKNIVINIFKAAMKKVFE